MNIMMENPRKIAVPDKLTLFEALCWNIANPYALSLKDMLSSYESGEKFNGVLAIAEKEELAFVARLSQKFKLPT